MAKEEKEETERWSAAEYKEARTLEGHVFVTHYVAHHPSGKQEDVRFA